MMKLITKTNTNTNVNNVNHIKKKKSLISKNYLCYVFIVFSLAQLRTKYCPIKFAEVFSCQKKRKKSKSFKVSVPWMKGWSMHVWLPVCFCSVAYMVWLWQVAPASEIAESSAVFFLRRCICMSLSTTPKEEGAYELLLWSPMCLTPI